jgi:rSAM/selenodomain-associated transferase 2
MQQMPLTVVIPTLNAGGSLAATLAALRAPEAEDVIAEVLVVDGGSTDDTSALAAAGGCRVLTSGSGRGGQLREGAAAAVGAWLLFLHADSRLAAGWSAAVSAFIAATAPGDARAAVFRFRLDDADPRARRIERLARWRARRLGLPFGDQGLLISRDFYEKLGGFKPLPLMEDVDLVRRIGRRRLATLPADAVTSAARYRRDGWTLRPLRNLAILGLYFLGLPPRLLTRLYG